MHFIPFHFSTEFYLDHAFGSGKHMEEGRDGWGEGRGVKVKDCVVTVFHSISFSHTLFSPLSFSSSSL
jgi:hypothetical protein